MALAPALLGAEAPVPAPGPAPAWTISRDGWTLSLSPDGDLLGLADRAGCELVRRGAGDGRIRVALVPPGRLPVEVDAVALVPCTRPVKADRTPDGAVFDYVLGPAIPLRVHDEIHLTTLAGAPAVRRVVHVAPDPAPLAADVVVAVGHPIGLPGVSRRVFVPRRDGRGAEVFNAPGRTWIWALGGAARAGADAEPLAIPLLGESDVGASIRLATFADPSLTTAFRLPHEPGGVPGEISWVWTGTRVPMKEGESRTLWTVIHPGPAGAALDAWRAGALAGVPAAPPWLHDVALVHADRLSRGGTGWFEDVEALGRLVPEPDRPKVLLLLHGWYDLVGRYTYDAKTGRLEASWTAGGGGGGGVPMSREEVSRRLAHAKSLGFRVGLVFAEGMQACDGVAPAETLARSSRTGPDVRGPAVVLNPCHPDVRARVLAALKALLAAHGKEIDALAWLETSDVPAGAVGPAEAPGYAAFEMMRLVLACVKETAFSHPGVAFLAGDVPGAGGAPCALMAHGCVAGGGFRPETLPFGLFPALGGVLWPLPRNEAAPASAQREVVLRLGVPVATASGWGETPGWAGMPAAERDALLALFRERAARPQRTRWLAE